MDNKPTKLEYEIAKYLRNQLPEKEAMFGGFKKVNYFAGKRAVDLIMDSKWTKANGGTLFTNRQDVVIFLNNLLLKEFYHRARKIKVDGAKKFKLDMHDVQVFEDSAEPYVWIYDPISVTAWLVGIGVIVGVIAFCAFPLWPAILRTWIYYICIAGLVFLSSILGLAVLRHIIFFILWTLTFGKLYLWILPNLTEDVGFFESFWPLYTLQVGGSLEAGGDGGGGGDASHSHKD